jgi:SAM-dependent methyltransferase
MHLNVERKDSRMLAYIVQKIEPSLKHVYRRFSLPPPPNLLGDREIEYSFISSYLPTGPGRSLEFGCGNSYLSLIAVRRGFTATAVDLLPVHWHYKHSNLSFIQKDFLDLDVSAASFDLVLNCSSIEHVGLTRYGDRSAAEGDLKAMRRLREVMKPGAIMLLTIPVGCDAVFAPLHRVYGRERLPRLLEGFTIEHCEYWTKNGENIWEQVDGETALNYVSQPHVYGLGCFVLRVPK